MLGILNTFSLIGDFFLKMAMKNFLHIAFLVTAIVLKVASLSIHMYVEHHEGESSGEKCELCEYALHNQELDSDVPDLCKCIEVICTNYANQNDLYKSLFRTVSIDSSLFGRPPPSLV